MPYIDAVRRFISDLDLDGLKDFHNNIVKAAIENKVLMKGTIECLRVVAIDGTELFESTKNVDRSVLCVIIKMELNIISIYQLYVLQ